ncbi:MAG: nucleotide sugar dehydrogenase [Elusimicrobia bacterium]|nr:nucleotide sugar dehydrogenase [Elusimicrobiota bacterium]
MSKPSTRRTQKTTAADLVIVGGAGHVGLPLALVFAGKGLNVLVYDINDQAFPLIKQGKMPFMERGAAPLLQKVLAQGRLHFTANQSALSQVPIMIVTIGTPIDEFMNPNLQGMRDCFDALLPFISNEQLVILRSTVYPGTTDWLGSYMEAHGKHPLLAFCPERIMEGYAIEELQKFPQIISATTPEALERAAGFFLKIAPEVIRLKPMEAEFAKLFCNSFRYIQFAMANQFYMMANSAGLDFYRIFQAMKKDYPRMQGMPAAGFSAGPCLLKDTMQLTAFYNNEFSLGYTAMLVNEGLPLYLTDRLAHQYDLPNLRVGLMGMAFKANSDDPRSSLSYKLKKVLTFKAKEVLTTDPFVRGDTDLKPLSEVLEHSDLFILCAPHPQYKDLDFKGRPVVDIWNAYGKGAII